MPIQTYRCPMHGDFEQAVPFDVDVPPFWSCSYLRRPPPVDTMVMSRSQVRRVYAMIGTCGIASAWQPPTGVGFKIT